MNNDFKTIEKTMFEVESLEETNYYFEQIFKLKRLSFELFRALRTSEIMINSETIIKYKDSYIAIITENIIYRPIIIKHFFAFGIKKYHKIFLIHIKALILCIKQNK